MNLTPAEFAHIHTQLTLAGFDCSQLLAQSLGYSWYDPTGLTSDEWLIATQVNLGNHTCTVEEDYHYCHDNETITSDTGAKIKLGGLIKLPVLSPKARIGSAYALSPAMQNWLRNETGLPASDACHLQSVSVFGNTSIANTVTLRLVNGENKKSVIRECTIVWWKFMRDCGWSAARKRGLRLGNEPVLGLAEGRKSTPRKSADLDLSTAQLNAMYGL